MSEGTPVELNGATRFAVVYETDNDGDVYLRPLDGDRTDRHFYVLAEHVRDGAAIPPAPEVPAPPAFPQGSAAMLTAAHADFAEGTAVLVTGTSEAGSGVFVLGMSRSGTMRNGAVPAREAGTARTGHFGCALRTDDWRHRCLEG